MPTTNATSATSHSKWSPYLANQYLAIYDVAPDGRFLMCKLDSQQVRTDVIIARNWVQQVKARLAGSQ